MSIIGWIGCYGMAAWAAWGLCLVFFAKMWRPRLMFLILLVATAMAYWGSKP